MIKSKIEESDLYRDHTNSATYFNGDTYVVDYSTHTDKSKQGLGTRFLDAKPTDIGSLKIGNNEGLEICCVRYTNKSFETIINGIRYYRSQCEGSVFPNISDSKSWILFTELKYCQENNNNSNINKARKQLFKTRYYYKSANIISTTNTCYLIISLPTQKMPYLHTVFAPNYLQELKRKHNIVMRAVGNIEVLDSEMLFVE